MRSLSRWIAPSLALLCTLAAVAASVVPSAAGDVLPPGNFVVGDDQDLTAGARVTFWTAQWWKQNDVTTDQTRPPFKGYALEVNKATCSFTTRTGNSAPPPMAPLNSPLSVIVTDYVTQSGSVISGTIKGWVIVHTDAGYDDNPGHAGTGRVEGFQFQPCVVGTEEL